MSDGDPVPGKHDQVADHGKIIGMLAGAAGGALAIATMELFAAWSALPLMSIPFATSIVLVMGAPEADAAQPRALVGGHVVATTTGLAVLHIAGSGPGAAGIAVGLAIVAMHLTRTFHPPAGIDPLLVVVNSLPWTFLFVPVATGATLLALFALLWHFVSRRYPWPREWW